jgi:predicted RNA-binding protein YlxR (DUF448 family)
VDRLPRAEPQRTCVGCRGRAGKGELIRVVRRPDGGVEVDPRGREPGRGAYLHPAPGCWAQAVRRGALARALRVVIGPDETARLMKELEGAITA